MEYRQPSYLIFAENETERYTILRSSLALVKDWEKGCFEIPLNMLEEFKITFGKGSKLVSTPCKYKITKDEIKQQNLNILDSPDHNKSKSPIISLKKYIEGVEKVKYIVLYDVSTKREINIGLNDQLFYGNDNINKLLRTFINRLDVLDVSKEKISVDLLSIFDDKNVIEQASKSISKSYGLIKDQHIAAWQLAYDVTHYISYGADKFCSRVLETLEYAHKQKEWGIGDSQEEEMSYFIINVSKGITAGEGYDIYLELDNKANEQDAVDKAIEDCLFEEPEDVNNIFSVEKVDIETYKKLTDESLKTFKIPVFFEVKSTSLDNAVKYVEKHIDEFKIPEELQYVENGFKIDYNSLQNLKTHVQNKELSLDNRIAEADKKKSTAIEFQNINNEISR